METVVLGEIRQTSFLCWNQGEENIRSCGSGEGGGEGGTGSELTELHYTHT